MFATSSGIVWLALAVHFAAGLVSIVTGTIALAVAKGGRLHKQSGLVFTWAMVVLGPTAAGIGTYEKRPGQAFGRLLAAYLVFTAMTTVKPLPGIGPTRERRADDPRIRLWRGESVRGSD